MADSLLDKVADFAYNNGPEWLQKKFESREMDRMADEQYRLHEKLVTSGYYDENKTTDQRREIAGMVQSDSSQIDRSLWDQAKDFAYRHAPEAVRDRIDDNRAIARLETGMKESEANGDTMAAQWLSKEPMAEPRDNRPTDEELREWNAGYELEAKIEYQQQLREWKEPVYSASDMVLNDADSEATRQYLSQEPGQIEDRRKAVDKVSSYSDDKVVVDRGPWGNDDKVIVDRGPWTKEGANPEVERAADAVRERWEMYARERPNYEYLIAWNDTKQQEPSTTDDQRQTNLWQQTMEIGRQARREEYPQQESPQEKEHQRQQLSL